VPAVDQFGQPVPRDRAYRLGRFISQFFHPIVNGIASFVVVGLGAPSIQSPVYGLLWALACIVTIITPTAAYFYLRLFRGDYSDDDVSRRSERTGLYLVAIGSTVGGSVLLYLVGLPFVFLRLLVAAVGVTGISMLINFRWKISVHSASIATLASLTTFFFQRTGIVLWLCAVIVGWARVRTGNHTPLQVLAGWIVAILGVMLAFLLRAS
jgi:membrane-associated phospholipid phosphatase